MPRVKMHHPDVGEMECSETAVAIHQRTGWIPAEGVRSMRVPAADGSTLTTGTVFPPETFDDEPDSPVDDADAPDAKADTPNRARKGNTPKEA